MQINYREKYKELKLKVKDLADLSFRLGVEEGLRQGQIQQQQQQQQEMEMQQAQMAMQAQQGGQPGQPGQPGQEDPQQGDPNAQPGQEASNGSELDSHIAQLESMIQKSDTAAPEYQALKKSLDSVKAFQADLRQKYDLKKGEQSIKAIGKALKKPFTINKRAESNLSQSAKGAIGSQEKLVQDIMKGWADEEKTVLAQVNKTLGIEGVLNKE